MSLESSQANTHTMTDGGPLAQVFINQAALASSYGLTAQGVTSQIIPGGGYTNIAVGATSSAAGQISVQRYIDVAGLIPQGPALTLALTAAAAGALNIHDDAAFQSFTITITGGTLTNVGLLLQST